MDRDQALSNGPVTYGRTAVIACPQRTNPCPQWATRDPNMTPESDKFGVLAVDPSKPDEGSHDLDIGRYSARAMQDPGEHRYALLGEHPRHGPTPAMRPDT